MKKVDKEMAEIYAIMGWFCFAPVIAMALGLVIGRASVKKR